MAEQNELADLGEYLATEPVSGVAMDRDEFFATRERLDGIAHRLSQSSDAGIQRIGIRLLLDRHSHNAQREIQRYLDAAASSC